MIRIALVLILSLSALALDAMYVGTVDESVTGYFNDENPIIREMPGHETSFYLVFTRAMRQNLVLPCLSNVVYRDGALDKQLLKAEEIFSPRDVFKSNHMREDFVVTDMMYDEDDSRVLTVLNYNQIFCTSLLPFQKPLYGKNGSTTPIENADSKIGIVQLNKHADNRISFNRKAHWKDAYPHLFVFDVVNKGYVREEIFLGTEAKSLNDFDYSLHIQNDQRLYYKQFYGTEAESSKHTWDAFAELYISKEFGKDVELRSILRERGILPFLSVSPDHSSIAFYMANFDEDDSKSLVVLDLNTGKKSILLDDVIPESNGPCWIGGGSHIAAISSKFRVRIVSLDTGESTLLQDMLSDKNMHHGLNIDEVLFYQVAAEENGGILAISGTDSSNNGLRIHLFIVG